MFVTLHSPPPSPSPVEITAAWAAALRSRINAGINLIVASLRHGFDNGTKVLHASTAKSEPSGLKIGTSHDGSIIPVDGSMYVSIAPVLLLIDDPSWHWQSILNLPVLNSVPFGGTFF